MTAQAAPQALDPSSLGTLDAIIIVLGLLVAVGVLFGWLVRRRGDPLAGAPPRPNQFREDSILIAVCAYLVGAAVFGGALQLAVGDAEDIRVRMAGGNGAQVLGIVACLILARKRLAGGVRVFLFGSAKVRPTSLAATVVLVALVGLAVCPIVAEGTVRLIQWIAPTQTLPVHPTIAALRGDTLPAWVGAGLWLGAALIAPVAEEMFFRGLVQTFLLETLGSRWAAIALASVLFGAVHVSQLHTIVALALLGGILGYVYEKSGALLPCILIHAVFNLKTLLWEA